MLLNFQPGFAAPILAGSKIHTLRAPRMDGRDAKVGDFLYLYTGLRTKSAKRICRPVKCTRRASVIIEPGGEKVCVDGIQLSGDELALFVLQDGFADSATFFAWWKLRANRLGVSRVDLNLFGWDYREVTPE